jgi:hypothetical protein
MRLGRFRRVTESEHVSAARAVYDATAEQYARRVGIDVSAAFEGPVDRAFLAAFVESWGSRRVSSRTLGAGRGAWRRG